MNKEYISLVVEIIEVNVEQGFAVFTESMQTVPGTWD